MFPIRRCFLTALLIPRSSGALLHSPPEPPGSVRPLGRTISEEARTYGKRHPEVSRRCALLEFFPAVGWTVVIATSPRKSWAAPPMTLGETDNVGARVERALRPKPPRLLRNRLNRDFAVLLMRASYNALDELDCVAMDQFQRDFFLIRQAEYETYVKLLGPGLVQQGDLADPYYFDFISFAQYSTIFREISLSPPLVFEEKQPVEVADGELQKFVTKVVRRDPLLTNEKLPAEHDRRVGTAILDRLEELFGDTPSAIPSIPLGSRPQADVLLASFTQLTNLFLVNGFAIDGSVQITSQGKSTVDASGSEFRIVLTSPANLWSGQALALKRASPSNSFILKTATELARRAGYSVYRPSVKYSNNDEVSSFSVS